jgi:predicted lysophospholipase L1 biosynthesis ABC-type transport system permease subunit
LVAVAVEAVVMMEVVFFLVDLAILVLPKVCSEGLGLAVGRAERRGAICGSQYVGRSLGLGGRSHLLGD